MRLSVVNLDDMVGGVTMPPKDPKIEPLQDFIQHLSPRLNSLRWVAEKKPEAFAPALFSFGIRRRVQIADAPSLLPPDGWAVAMLVPAADRLRRHFGANWDPMALPSTWPNILYEAVDDVMTGLWHLRGGMTVSAALIARSLLERWTLNVAHHFEIEREPGEDDAEYISRVWRSYGHPTIPEEVGAWWSWLSELLHGRDGNAAFGTDNSRAIQLVDSDNVSLHSSISRILELSLRQVRGGLSALAEAEELTDTIAIFQCRAPQLSPMDEPFPLTEAFLPLEYYESYRVRSEQWVQLASIYRTNVEDESWNLTTGFSPVMACEALLERRGRAVERARLAFEDEKRLRLADFDPGMLASKLFRFISIAQMGRILANDASAHERASLVTAAQAIDGAAQLWLEDSDYSMGCLRVLLEQTARLRVHRLKPDRAARLEAAYRTPSSRWISAAGWGRLAVLMRAVNEFAHIGLRTRRAGARRVLQRLQVEEDGLQTSRGDALMSVVYMFAFELHARLSVEPVVASAFTRTVTLLDEDGHVARLESYLQKAHAWRQEDFGSPDFVAANQSVPGAVPVSDGP
ncbi:hypothetical protein JNB63_11815 [Microbacterium trichothecenolyticum]|uniref:hypothetical protein n=1 Tax=Microbacterium trichothecenolyticum TaxID=69370 RepID=UPI001C6F565B|nr:hypothetical protein [Microbacterium trichothecenolyticum]MBW9120781.1 hypothetical protein [Microbacterium trichothecenolyticum]